MKFKIILCCFILVLFTSCSTTKSVDLDLKVRSNTEIVNKLTENKVDFAPQDLATLKDLKTWATYSKSNKIVVPEVHFYNKNGFKVSQKFSDSQCSQLLRNFETMENYPVNENEKITDVLNDFTFISESEILNDFDFYIIINWALLTQNNHETAFNWYNSAKNIKDKKVKVVLLNLDLNESWNITEQQKEILKLK